jgi:ADP-ribose pyrophosphatase YjhB (NUDIX family)
MQRRYEVYIDGKELVALVGRLRSGEFQQGIYMQGDVEKLWGAFQEQHTFVQAAGGCVTDEQGRLLAIHRLGLWDLPKGKVEKGEKLDEAAVREVQEECGLQEVKLIKHICDTWHTYERKGRQHLKRTDWYLMRGNSAEALVPQLDEDISEVRWMAVKEIPAMRAATYPSLRKVIDAWESAVHHRA